jgi:hypothetical protein
MAQEKVPTHPAAPAPPAQHERSAGSGWFTALLNLSFVVVVMGASVMALVNVFGSSIEVDRLASETACQGQAAGCEAVTMQWERTPLAHTMQVSTTGGTKVVKCQREHILLGAWGCTAAGKVPPALPPHMAPASAEPAKTVYITIPASSAQPKNAKTPPSVKAASSSSAP